MKGKIKIAIYLLLVIIITFYSCNNPLLQDDTEIEPAAPDTLSAMTFSSTQIDLTWNDNSDDEDGFKIEMSLDGSTFTQIYTVAAGVTSYSDTGLDANTLYYYQVRAYNTAGDSGYSNIANATTTDTGTLQYIANHLIAKESVLRSIPESAIITAKDTLHIMYCGTSHSSQTADGMRGLMEYKTGDRELFAVTFDGNSETGKLDIDYRPTSPIDVYSAYDLSNDGTDDDGHTPYFNRTVEYLDHTDNYNVNVVMWSWCSIAGHDVQIYLDNFSELIDMYKPGGAKGRTEANDVTFVLMTGYARGIDADTPEPPYIESPYQNHKRIVDFAVENNVYCLDYWSQDTYNYGDDFYKPEENGNENVQHYEWVNAPGHDLGTHWFETLSYISSGSGSVKWPAHCDGTYAQHLTSNRRAYAAWWIWARIAGWDGN